MTASPQPPIALRWTFAGLALFTGLVCFIGLGERSLWASHEARAAQNAASLLDGDATIFPERFDGDPEYQKPPGFYWFVALTGQVTGQIDAWTTRFPDALSAWLTVIAVYVFLWQRGQPRAALISALILLSMVRFLASARVARIDMPLAAMITFGLLIWFAPGVGRPPWWRVILASVCIACAVLLKGPIGLALPGLVLVLVYLIERQRLPWLALIVSLTMILACSAPWFVFAHWESNGEFTRQFFWYHNVQRALGGAAALASHPWWYYAPRFLVDALPWSPFLLLLIRYRSPESRFGLIWLVSMLVLLSFSQFKRADYLVPALPGAAIAIGSAMDRWWHTLLGRRQRQWQVIAFVLVLCSIGGLIAQERYIAPKDAAENDPTSFAERVRQRVGSAEIILFRVESHLLAWELKRPLRTAVEWETLQDWLRTNGRQVIIIPKEVLADWDANIRMDRFIVLEQSEAICPKFRHRLILIETSARVDADG